MNFPEKTLRKFRKYLLLLLQNRDTIL